MATQVFYCDLGGGAGDVGAIKYGWRANELSYDNIGAEMGVEKATDTTQGIVFGANRPKPIPVRINYRVGNASGLFGSSNATRSVTRWAEPDKVGNLTLGGVINGKKIKIGANGAEFDINSVSPVGVRR